MLFKDADKSINIGQKHEWAYTTTLDYTTNEAYGESNGCSPGADERHSGVNVGYYFHAF